MAEDSLEVFQDLQLKTQGSPINIRNAILGQIKEPWSHDQEREDSVGSKPNDAKNVLILNRVESDGIEAASLVLWRRDSGYKVANIIPSTKSELGIRAYNAILNDFVTQIAEPAKQVCMFEMKLTKARETLDDWLSPGAASDLRAFSTSANKLMSHPLDVERWNRFLISMHSSGSQMDSSLLVRWLTEIDKWPEDRASELAIEYEFALELLRQYDQSKCP